LTRERARTDETVMDAESTTAINEYERPEPNRAGK
jgi:hypothetical protein